MTPYEKFIQSKTEQVRVYKYLQRLNMLIKNRERAQEGYLALLAIDEDTLHPENSAYLAYLKAKYFAIQFRNSNEKNVELLLTANDFYDDVIAICRQHYLSATEKMHFGRCHVKILLAFHHTLVKERHVYANQARDLLERSLQKCGLNSQFTYLKSKLENINQ